MGREGRGGREWRDVWFGLVLPRTNDTQESESSVFFPSIKTGLRLTPDAAALASALKPAAGKLFNVLKTLLHKTTNNNM